MVSEDGGRNTALIPAQRKSEIRVSVKCARNGERVSIRIIDMNPPGGRLGSGLVDGLETVLGQAFGCPLKKILRGKLPRNLELADADGIRKNAHEVSPLEDHV
jgi:hypothetical protein